MVRRRDTRRNSSSAVERPLLLPALAGGQAQAVLEAVHCDNGVQATANHCEVGEGEGDGRVLVEPAPRPLGVFSLGSMGVGAIGVGVGASSGLLVSAAIIFGRDKKCYTGDDGRAALGPRGPEAFP